MIIFSFVRSALGTPTIPPNQVLVGLSLFLTFFVMMPTFREINHAAVEPYLEETIAPQEAMARAFTPLRAFMLRQTREKDLALFIGINGGDISIDGDDILGDGVNVAARLEALAGPAAAALQNALLHRRQDAKAFKAYRDQLAALLSAQTRERRALAQRHLAEVTEQARREKALLLLWFVLFWGIFLFFYAGSYKYGADVRFALLSLMPLAVLAGLGGEAVARWAAGATKSLAPPVGGNSIATTAAVLAIDVIFLWTSFLPLVRLEGQEAWGARCDHRFAREAVKKIPDRSIVLTHVPTMFLVWGRNAISPNVGISDQPLVWDMMQRYRGHVYFHWGYWCNTKADSNRQICEEIARKLSLIHI